VTLGGATFPWETAIVARARGAGLELSDSSATGLAAHARAVLAANGRLHLTTIVDPAEFIERHVGESLEGAAMLPPAAAGPLLDLGSGNGYPGIPVAVAHPGLVPCLVEASAKKAAFLRQILDVAGCSGGSILNKSVTRAADLADRAPISVLLTRAMGGWERIVPKLAPCLAPDGTVLIWATTDAERVFERVAWSRLRLVACRKLPGRDRSMIFEFQA
jgi:16S rRNA (guanine527-N7)-methyltransferase